MSVEELAIDTDADSYGKTQDAAREAQALLDDGDTHLAQVIDNLAVLSKARLRGIAFGGESDDTSEIAARYLLDLENGFRE